MSTLTGLVLGLALMAGTPVYLILQIVTPVQLPSATWRMAALLPLAFAVPIAAWCFYALSQDSNLWPLPFILFAPLGALYLVALLATRVIVRHA
jgi:hypothetical protein